MMTGKEVLSWASNCTMDELVNQINRSKADIKLMEQVKRVRIKDGEKTADMIKREQKKQKKQSQAQSQQQTARPVQ